MQRLHSSISSLEEEDVDDDDAEKSQDNGYDHNPSSVSQSHTASLEKDVLRMAKKLVAKDKAISELQRSLSPSESKNYNKDVELTILNLQIQKFQSQSKDHDEQLNLADKRYQTMEDLLDRTKKDLQSQRMEYEQKISLQRRQKQELEKPSKQSSRESKSDLNSSCRSP